jgi:hypothetical protein
MSSFPSETAGCPANTGRPPDQWVTDEARLLARISGQLDTLQSSVDRIESGATEFLPWLRSIMGRRSARAAARAADMFRG